MYKFLKAPQIHRKSSDSEAVEKDSAPLAAVDVTVIDGKTYDKSLLELCKKFAADGQVGYPEAKLLWKDAMDDGVVTDIERATLEYCLKTYKFTDKASKFITTLMSVGTSKSFYKIVEGVKYDRQLLEQAEVFAADGQVSFD